MVGPVERSQDDGDGLEQFRRNHAIHLQGFQGGKQIGVALNGHAMLPGKGQDAVGKVSLPFGHQPGRRIEEGRVRLVA